MVSTKTTLKEDSSGESSFDMVQLATALSVAVQGMLKNERFSP
jgi:hypothetical protein